MSLFYPMLGKELNNMFHIHWWKKFEKESNHSVYFCRKCRCGVVQIQAANSDNRWREENKIYWYSWELEDFKTAKETKE